MARSPTGSRTSSGELYAGAAEFCVDFVVANREIFETMLH
jgi:hypothetical protein